MANLNELFEKATTTVRGGVRHATRLGKNAASTGIGLTKRFRGGDPKRDMDDTTPARKVETERTSGGAKKTTAAKKTTTAAAKKKPAAAKKKFERVATNEAKKTHASAAEPAPTDLAARREGRKAAPLGSTKTADTSSAAAATGAGNGNGKSGDSESSAS